MLSKKIFSTQKISLIERSAIIEKKGNDLSLMKKAARFSWNEIRKKYPSSKRWLILCGIGNNAGDRLTINPSGDLNVAGITTATQLFEGTSRVTTTGKAIAMAMLFG